MVGFMATLSSEQKLAALAFCGDDTHVVALREALGWFIADERFQVAVGGNPIAVEGMLAEAQARYTFSRPITEDNHHDLQDKNIRR